MIEFEFTGEQAQMQSVIADFLSAEAPVNRLRDPQAIMRDRAVVRSLNDLGVIAVSLDDRFGGAGLGLADEAILQREFGRFLAPLPSLSRTIASRIAAAAGAPELARDIVSGARPVVPAIGIGAAQVAPAIAGDFLFLGEPEDALAFAWTGTGGALWAVEAAAPLRPSHGVAAAIPMHLGTCEGAAALCWAPGDEAETVASVLLASQLAGMAEHLCDMAVGYAMLREQFGRPIGSFQAIKHHCADMKMAAVAGWSQAATAAMLYDARDPEAQASAAMARVVAGKAALANARAAIQIHGGTGFTADCDAHLYLKRADLLDQVGGGMRGQVRRLGKLLF
jgi:alkylation response protein AidB-like acyl-CoA dehydrogenase